MVRGRVEKVPMQPRRERWWEVGVRGEIVFHVTYFTCC